MLRDLIFVVRYMKQEVNTKGPVQASRTRSFGSRDDSERFQAGVGISHKRKPSKTTTDADV